MAKRGWGRRFEDPIPLPRGRQIVTLEDAARYIQKLPKVERDRDVWQRATGILIDAAEGRDSLMHARIGIMQAINRARPAPAPGPRRKRAKVNTIIRS